MASYPTYSQVVKLHKGQTFPFDTGVGMSIEIYRSLRVKSIECDTFIVNVEKEIALKDSTIEVQTSTIEAQAKHIKKNKFITKKAPYLILLAFIGGLFIN